MENEIAAERDAAARTGRLLAGVFDPDTRGKILAFTAELETDALERSSKDGLNSLCLVRSYDVECGCSA